MTAKTVIIFILILSGMITLFLAVYGVKNRRETAGRAFIALMVSITLYSLGYALEISYSDIAGIRFALRVEYLGVSFLPAFWLILTLQYTNNNKILTPYFYSFIFVIPVATLVLHYSNDFHHLYYRQLDINNQGPFPLVIITP